MHSIQLEKFQGPLDLLLQLIEREELDITTVSLAKVCDQYIAHLQNLPEMPPEELADFLVIAARLLFIKSRNLLPLLIWDKEEEPGDLETRLKMYKEYVDAARKVQDLLDGKRHTFVREKPPASALGFSPPKDLTPGKMAQLFRDVLLRLVPIVKPPEALIEKTVSIHEKIRHIQDLIKKAERVSFHDVLKNAETRAEIIVCFLAMLELVKQKHVKVSQDTHFHDIHIEKMPV